MTVNNIAKTIMLFLSTLFLSNCTDKENISDCLKTSLFFYNSTTGKCENCNGDIGYNLLDIDAIRTTKNAECFDLSNQELVYLLDTSKIENFRELGNNQISEYNFKGSKFDSAQLFFNDIDKANFQGADLSKIEYGYANIVGSVDKFTILPENGSCKETKNDLIKCSR